MFHLLLHRCFSSHSLFCLFLILSMAPTKKPPSKPPHHRVRRPSGGLTKKSCASIQHTLLAKHPRVGMDQFSSNSSVSSTASINDCDDECRSPFSDYVLTPLPPPERALSLVIFKFLLGERMM
jgi:hypothetical protein